MRRALVTGGAGFIGSHIAHALIRRGDFVRVLDNFSSGAEDNLPPRGERLQVLRGDVSQPAVCAEAVKGIDVIFHHAALASVSLSVERPRDSHQMCNTATLTLLDEARRAGVKRFVYAASSSAYGDQPTSAKRETDLPMTLSPYAAAKLAGEFYCQAFFQTYGLETVCLRYFNVFGPRQDPNSPYSAVIPLFITAILDGRSPTIFGDGQQARDFIYIDNVVDANLLAADRPGVAGKVFNIGTGRMFSLLQLLSELEMILGQKCEPIHQPARAGDVRESLADMTLARNLLGFHPAVDLREGLRRTVESYRQAQAAAAR